MTRPTRDDFLTLIHKALRRALFAVTTAAATIDWDAPGEVAAFDAHWRRLHHLLDIHAAHEDDHCFPLLHGAAPDVLAVVEAGHHEQDGALTKLAAVVREAVASPDPARGVEVHRELSAFVAGYLLHLLDEETLVMPSIWQHCTDDDLARARASFMAALSPDDAALSRRAMLPALSPHERAAVLQAMRATAPAEVVAAALDDARATLDDHAWGRLAADLSIA